MFLFLIKGKFMHQWPIQDLEPLFFQVLTAASWQVLVSAACPTVTTIFNSFESHSTDQNICLCNKNWSNLSQIQRFLLLHVLHIFCLLHIEFISHLIFIFQIKNKFLNSRCNDLFKSHTTSKHTWHGTLFSLMPITLKVSKGLLNRRGMAFLLFLSWRLIQWFITQCLIHALTCVFLCWDLSSHCELLNWEGILILFMWLQCLLFAPKMLFDFPLSKFLEYY